MSIPNVPSLTKLIQSGSEGGLEFSRILNQLLFEDSQMYHYYFQSFSDSSGDYKGVDALMERGFKKLDFNINFLKETQKITNPALKNRC